MYIAICKKYYDINNRKWVDRPAEEIQEEREARVSQSEATLWYNVIFAALEDLKSDIESDRKSAISFLSGEDGMLQEVADAINEYDAEDQPFDSALLQNPPTIKLNATVIINLFKKSGPEGIADLFEKKMKEYTEALLAETPPTPVVQSQLLAEAA